MIDERTPVLITAGQVVEREASSTSPMQLAAIAARNAIANADSDSIISHIDTIAVTRLFSDMGELWPCPWGRSNNPPESIARQIGAKPKHRIYSQVGGNESQAFVIEFARDIAMGKRDMVLIAGAEATKNQRYASRNNTVLNWHEQFSEPLDDRGIDASVVTDQEINNGLFNVLYYYALIEQAQRHQAGRNIKQHQQAMAALLASFSRVAANNPYAQFVGQQSAADILSAAPLTNLYTKRMVAQDSVNQGAALIMCSLAKARELAISDNNIIYLHGLAHASDVPVSQRSKPETSIVATRVVDQALQTAKLTVDDIALIDIYSCFPCAVTAVAQHLSLPIDGSRDLTVTGGLPYFGGPGNNYSMHALAEIVMQLRQRPDQYALVTANGGVLSKHASGVYSRRPSTIDWSTHETKTNIADIPVHSIDYAPSGGTIVSYTIYPDHSGALQVIVLAQTNSNKRFVAINAKDDTTTALAMTTEEPSGKAIIITPGNNGKLYFQLVNQQ